MVKRLLVAASLAALLSGGLIVPASAAPARESGRVGTGVHSCVLAPGANCRDVIHRWALRHHGDLRGIKFARAQLHGAQLQGARLNRANFRGAVLRGADFRFASLKQAEFGPAAARVTLRDLPSCISEAGNDAAECAYADLRNANMSHANLQGAALVYADLTGADLSYSNLSYADFMGADLTGANLLGSDVSNARFLNAKFSRTTCPNGTVTDTGC